jgi:transposase InsO family protein
MPALGLSRSSYYWKGQSSLERRRIRKEVLELSAKHARYGYRRITALMRRGGSTTSFAMNALTANSSAIWRRRALSWKAGVSEYNERRPHSLLGYQTPSEYAPKAMNRFDAGFACN